MVIRRLVFGEMDRRELLEALRRCRGACVEAHRHTGFDTDLYKRVTALEGAIDDVAEVLTGNREHFWLKSYGTPST